MAISSPLPPTCAAHTLPSPASMSPALRIAVQKWWVCNTETGAGALKAVAAKLCWDGSGPRAVFSKAEVRRNLTALPEAENFSMRKDLEKLPLKICVSSSPELAGPSHKWDESNSTAWYSVSTPEDSCPFSRCRMSARGPGRLWVKLGEKRGT